MLPFQLAPGDWLFLFTGLLAVLTALHLLAHKSQVQRVSTLHFWSEGKRSSPLWKTRLQQPWSLLLQALALGLLLTALTDPHWGEPRPRRHVLLIDVSAGAPVEREQVFLLDYLKRIPERDAVQVVSIGGITAPLTGFTANRTAAEQALLRARPTVTAIDWDLALIYAKRARAAGPEQPGEIVYSGPHTAPLFTKDLRTLSVTSVPPSVINQACAIPQRTALRIGLSTNRPELWTAALHGLSGAQLFFFTPAQIATEHADLLVLDQSLPATIPASGPVLVVRPPHAVTWQRKDSIQILSNDPFAGAQRFNPRTPVQLRQTIERLVGYRGRPVETVTQPVGEITLPLRASESAGNSELWQGSSRLPFHVRDDRLFAYTETPGSVLFESPVRRVSFCLKTAAVPAITPSTDIARLPGSRAKRTPWKIWQLCTILAGLLLLADWWWFGARLGPLLWVRGTALAGIVVALIGLSGPLSRQKKALLGVIDASASVDVPAIEQAKDFVRGLGAATTTAFASEAHQVSSHASVTQMRAAGGNVGATDIESAMLDALATSPEGDSPRLLLFTDGNETIGSALRAAAALHTAGVAVDAFPMSSGGTGVLSIQSVLLPPRAFSGETLQVPLTVVCPQPVAARIELTAQGMSIGSSTFRCQPGTQTLQIKTRLRGIGPALVTARLSADGFRPAAVQQPIVLSTPKAVYVSGDETLTDINLPALLRKAGFELSEGALLPGDLSGRQLVVLNNLDLDQLPSNDAERLRSFVHQGGGLLIVSGDHQTYHKHHDLTSMDQLLPGRIAPPESPEGIAIVLVIDKSSSMEGRKIQLARLSASGVVDHLRPVDSIGILIFDNAFSWAVPMRHANDKPAIKELIAGIIPDGGTQIPTALAEAYHRILGAKAAFKHIVLLTDGISEEADSLSMSRDAQLHQVSISTVGLGQDVNKSYLQKIAESSGGHSYFLNDPAYLQQLLLKDIEDFTAKTVVEKPVHATPVVAESTLDGVNWNTAPVLQGYVRYESRPGAQTLLQIGENPSDPLLLRWQYGLGRVTIFASDAKSRWATNWVSWSGFDTFWTNVTRDLIEQDASGGRLRAELDRRSQLLRLISAGTSPPPAYFFFGPNAEKGVLHWHRSEAGFTAETRVRWAAGLWLLRPEHVADEAPELALLARDAESTEARIDTELLQNIASITGGQFNPSPARIRASLRTHGFRMTPLWPLFLWMVVALTILEVAASKRIGRWKAARSKVTEEPHILIR